MKPIEAGQKVPDVTFKARVDGQWRDVTTADIFGGKNVVVFSLPGAFTPTCSSTHLPRYEQLAATFEREGIDDIVCISVNDAFVMEEWAKAQDVKKVHALPDGNGDFSRGMGLLVDKRSIGFGERSWRYSMLVRDGVIEKLFIEPEKPGDPFEVSDADTMLKYINPKAQLPPAVSLLSRPGCPHCARARKTLDDRGWSYEEIELGRDATTVSLQAISGQATTPQVFVNGKHIGGADDLERYLADQPALAAR